ncbi:hypothetical protein C1645_817716, partial [Glomus cerebriforme]
SSSSKVATPFGAATTQSSSSSKVAATPVGFEPATTTQSSSFSEVASPFGTATTQSSNFSQVMLSATTKRIENFISSSSITQISNASASKTSGFRSLRKIRKANTSASQPISASQNSEVISLPQISDLMQGFNGFSIETEEQQNLDFLKCKESFIFSLNYRGDDDDDEVKFLKSDVKDFDYGIGLLTSNFTGPIFGQGDLIMSGNNFKTDKMCCCNQNSYQKSILESTEKFSIDEYEVFQIIPKRSIYFS